MYLVSHLYPEVETAVAHGFNVNIVPIGSSQQDVDLSWLAYDGTYTVHHSNSDPYFAPQTATTLAVSVNNYYTHSGVLGNPASNNFYAVEVNNCAGNAQSAHVGTFTFELVAGS